MQKVVFHAFQVLLLSLETYERFTVVKSILTEFSRIKKVTSSKAELVDDVLAVEEPLEIVLSFGAGPGRTDRNISVTMRTPGNDEELALGFLYTEGIIRDIAHVEEVKTFDTENRVSVLLRGDQTPDLQRAERSFYTTSSCGVCGKSSLEAIRTLQPRHDSRSDVRIEAGFFHALETTLRKQQAAFETTGGLHASALFDLDGRLTLVREDVGRHNALDKVIGAALIDRRVPLINTILLLSGRASFELIQKACMAGISIVAAVGAPSTLAVGLAREFDITLIGFLRATGFNIYSGAQRITTS